MWCCGVTRVRAAARDRFLESAPTYEQPIVPKGTKPSDGGAAQQPAQPAAQPAAAGEKKKRKAGGKKKGKKEL